MHTPVVCTTTNWCTPCVNGKSPTSVAEVVDEDDLFQQNGRCGLQHAVYGPQQGGPGLVVEGDDHRRGG